MAGSPTPTASDSGSVTLPESLLSQYARFSLYNSPYPAHDAGCAIDLYPGTLRDGRTTAAPSPLAGVVRETRTVRAPPKPYAPEHDHLILLEPADPAFDGLTARILHVEPTVEAGDRVRRGESLGRLVRAGFFAPWVDNHLHLGFRGPEQNPYRASGSLPLAIDAEVRPLEWDGTGTVVSTGETYAVLDAPSHPAPGETFVGIGADDGGILDGGLPHYDGGGLLAAGDLGGNGRDTVSLNGDRLGTREGRTIEWDDVVVTANGDPITGLSLFCARDADFGAKLICPDRSFAVSERVRVRVRPTETA
ncbi:hypothetical protein [Halopiger xanaduensis]|uniref:Uncharacterized protein n=1 Tax=Halopiger xanaduensis (strain DSM 18323 / JCM 14033 / SH-6) TaxID=797210 RepID=F8D537_HALXS|nr:hypothetical protein [Halopiger xanaduensis]AEH36389.1 hypothetical protein Halxa_1761 [Halopiger xanaduensis SH-6]